MGDAWDDEDFEVASLVPRPPPVAMAWDDEEEEDEEGSRVLTVAEIETKKKRDQKMAAEMQKRKTEALEQAVGDNETAEDKKLRERRQVEDADHELTDELFGGGASAKANKKDDDMVSLKMKDLKDYLAVAMSLNERFDHKDTKNNHVVAFTKEILRKGEARWETADLTEMILILQNQKDAKLKEAAAPTKGKKDVKVKAKAKSKAELAKDKKTQYEKFGGNFEDQEYDGYADKYEDDFF